jgi:hypothetical protein
MYDFDDISVSSDEDDGAELKSPEDAADRFGIRTALIVLCVGFFIAAVWVMNSPSFQKCSALENLKDRTACYEGLRSELSQPPVK